jgi:hypothetical protein
LTEQLSGAWVRVYTVDLGTVVLIEGMETTMVKRLRRQAIVDVWRSAD